jgi:hypothetical protein
MFGEFIELGDFPHERNIQLATSIKVVEANVKGHTVLNDAPCWRVLRVGGCFVLEGASYDRGELMLLHKSALSLWGRDVSGIPAFALLLFASNGR